MANENDNRIENSDELMRVELALRQLRPEPPRIERDRLMFLAGRASAGTQGARGSGFGARDSEGGGQESGVRRQERRNWLWPVVAGVLGATAAGLAMALVLRWEPREVIVYRDVPGPAMTVVTAPRGAASAEDFQVAAVVMGRPAASRVPVENYLRTREVAVRMGLDAIGSQPGGNNFSAPPTYGDLLLGLVGSRRESEGAAERRENFSNM